MQRCDHCKVNIKGEYQVCPLCGGILKDKPENNNDVFPNIPTIYQEFNIFIRIIILISIAVVVISLAINMIATKDSKWSLLVTAGIGCMWVSLFVIIQKKHNIPKTIVWQAGVIYLLIDGIFGFIPILFILFGWVTVAFPSVICVATSAISLSALILFHGDNIKSELDKRMHI